MKQLTIGYIMTKSDKIKQLKSSLKNTKAQLKRREAKIARLEARNSQLEAEAKKKEKDKDKLMEQNLRNITKRYQDISFRNLSSKSLSQSDAQQMQALEILLRFLKS